MSINDFWNNIEVTPDDHTDDHTDYSEWYQNRMTQNEYRDSQRDRIDRMVQARLDAERARLIELSNDSEPHYLIIQETSIENLQNKVDLLLSLGWNVKGGFNFSKEGRIRTYSQAVVKSHTKPILNNTNHFDNEELFNV